ncbi:hypothetical protein [Clostridium sp. KNHs216]|nr:hypothetical protein [Clostridium sp. KNHs216]TQI69007.1 hypothetical protein LY85_3756 [Clostridium sp. KNHs216]
MWAYAHMIFQNHDILPAAFLNFQLVDLTRQRAFLVASDLVAAKHMKER